ncbi:MAG TPA: GFA family protein [Solirubrobacteraceae bacterium]|jgi:hypothetical protein|nr:GFA family protein [Solirubrobacteraceae bacterium]
MGKFDGQCLCGSLTYTCDADPMMTAICHCLDCQRQSGAAYSVNVVVAEDEFHLSGDTAKTYKTTGVESGAERERVFCANCGSPIFTRLHDMPGVLAVKAGTLLDHTEVAPEAELWTKRAHAWLQNDEERGLFETGLPT